VLKKISKNQLFNDNHGWLNTFHHFSFARYYNPERMGFGQVRVINNDYIAPRTGFETHPHKDMEIITYVVNGNLTHKDSMGNVGRFRFRFRPSMLQAISSYKARFNMFFWFCF